MISLTTQITDGALAVINTIGLIFNLLVFYISVYRMKLKGLDMKLTMLTSVIDIIYAVMFLLLLFTRWGMDMDVIDVHSLWCILGGTLIQNLALCSLNVVGVLALIRYLSIVKKRELEQGIWVWIALSIIVVSMAITFTVTPGGVFKLMPSGSYCHADISTTSRDAWSIMRKFDTFFGFVRLLISIVVIFFCYIKITLFYRKQLLTVANELTAQCFSTNKNDSTLTTLPWNNYLARRAKVTISMILILGAYAINLLPEVICVMIILITKGPAPAYFDGLAISLISASIITNPIFVLSIHEATHYEFMVLLGLKKPRISSHPYADQFTS